MEKLKIFIVENDPYDLKTLTWLLKNNKNDIVGELVLAKSYDEALDILSGNENFDLSILDINLDVGTSFKLIKSFPKIRFGIVAFVSNEPIPADINLLTQPTFRITKSFDKEQIANFILEVIGLREKANKKNESIYLPEKSPDFFVISIKDKPHIVIEMKQLICIKASGNDSKETKFYCNNQTKEHTIIEINSNEKFASVLNRIRGDVFFQCFKGTIVNVNYVSEIMVTTDNGGTLYLKNRALYQVPYSDTYAIELLKKFNLRKV